MEKGIYIVAVIEGQLCIGVGGRKPVQGRKQTRQVQG